MLKGRKMYFFLTPSNLVYEHNNMCTETLIVAKQNWLYNLGRKKHLEEAVYK